MAAPTYLHIRGSLAENMVYTPRAGYESSRPGTREQGDPAYSLALLDRGGRLLVSVSPQVVPRGCGAARDPLRSRVRGVVPMHPEAASYEVRRGEITLHAAIIADQPPRISRGECRRDGGVLSLSWESGEREGVTYSVVAAMETGRHITLARGLTAPTYSIDLGRIPASGKGKLTAVAHDGVRSSELEITTIDVPAHPPRVHILAPPADARLRFGQPLSLLGSCLDRGGRPCSPETAVWLLDSERVAEGTMIAAIEELAPGAHRLTLRHGDDAGGVEVSVPIEVEEPDADDREWEVLMGRHGQDDVG